MSQDTLNLWGDKGPLENEINVSLCYNGYE